MDRDDNSQNNWTLFNTVSYCTLDHGGYFFPSQNKFKRHLIVND